MKFFETKEFQKLNRQWKKKLKASGFKDIERNEHRLSMYSYEVFDAYDPLTEDYYNKALNFLQSHTFQSDLDRFIWSLHANGRSVREISSELESSTIYGPLSKSSVHERITKLEAQMLKRAV
jgi:hypothetical protein